MKTKRKIKRKENKLKIGWKDSLSYLKETLPFIYAIVGLFFASSVFSFIFPEQFVFFNDLIRDLRGQVEGLGLFGLTWFILQNNVTSAFTAMVLGVFLGVFPVFNALINGTLLGYVFSLASAEAGFGVIIYLVPHGIFELPAIFIALGLGSKLGMFIFSGKGKRASEFKRRFWNSLTVFFFVVLPLLVIAAIIEGLLIFLGG